MASNSISSILVKLGVSSFYVVMESAWSYYLSVVRRQCRVSISASICCALFGFSSIRDSSCWIFYLVRLYTQFFLLSAEFSINFSVKSFISPNSFLTFADSTSWSSGEDLLTPVICTFSLGTWHISCLGGLNGTTAECRAWEALNGISAPCCCC